MFKNKSKYSVLTINVTNREESEKFQRLANRYGIHWYGYDIDHIYDLYGQNRIIYLVFNDETSSRPRMLWSENIDSTYLNQHIWNKKVYKIENYNEVHEFLKNDGIPIPHYRPRKVDKSI